ncbi:HpcH/HpaI aldolase/citrate lyase family protein [Aurantimicrobium minutum]|jgi:citrate lyase subunit beta / citryl-CoA lyase|uniref:HpcH/HpaI aldolase/citrate lyase family protein n=1 Tax=Aurantimicrobium minutum TaxID=708131 RepID=UPI002404B6F5|nr:CoA ester lyase [Aurantimicrobium minutum]MDF9810563.1 citrate lyase subunit beta/citryl-CoA lyase [Aurantimicrobium minutum]MDH6255818.1 citrate lyase subunit beta/citryl-CoA lyase [Aurantimicrobium minutum]MDH6410333.1 citrate lyase subunit beta/citryl-CoA lyase [Aurantimicrobium minutum]
MVSAEISRSWLLVNGSHSEEFDAAAATKADQIVLDIEDAVDPSQKAQSRAAVAKWLETKQAWVRINDRSSEFWSDDIDELRDIPGLLGVMLAKTEDGSHVTETFDRLGGKTRVLALVESALGIEEAREIACARGAFRLAFGSGDYRRDTGTSVEDIAMAYPRSRLVVASRIGNIPGPIDGPTVGTSYGILREKSEHAVALGMTGKLCLHHDQIPVINEAISPTQSDVAWARTFLADFEARGRVVRDGSDLPRLGRAEKIEKLAVAFGINPS